jgi:hypothetical protein
MALESLQLEPSRELGVDFADTRPAALAAVPFGDVARAPRSTEVAWRRAYERGAVTDESAGRSVGAI